MYQNGATTDREPDGKSVAGKSEEESSQEETEIGEDRERELERLLSASGYGLFHALLLLIATLCSAVDATEVLGVAFVMPVAEEDLKLTTARKGYLDASVFIGLLIGSYLWGILADVCGRKVILLLALLLNGILGLTSAFSPNFLFFFFFRIFSGIAAGGALPVLFAYVVEFYPQKKRRQISMFLSSLYISGAIYAAFIAWALLGTESSYSAINFYIGSLRFSNWRLFLIICTFPAFLFTFLMLFMPESPAYLFQAERMAELNHNLRRIHRVNTACCCCCKIQKPPKTDGIPLLTRVDHNENGHSPSLGPPHPSSKVPVFHRKLYPLFAEIKQVLAGITLIFGRKYLRATILLVIISVNVYFGFDALVMWFPEYFKDLNSVDSNLTVTDTGFSNETILTQLRIYQDTLYISLATLPGTIVGILLVGLTGGKILLVLSLVITSLSVFLIWAITNYAAVVGVASLFSGCMLVVFGTITLIVANVYEPGVRATSFGVFLGVGRIGAILGNITFGYLMDVDRAIPILIVASLLAFATIAAIFLPQVYRPENSPPLERALSRLKSCRLRH